MKPIKSRHVKLGHSIRTKVPSPYKRGRVSVGLWWAGSTLEDNRAHFGSDSPLPIIKGAFCIRGWTELIICTNNPVVQGLCEIPSP